LPPVSEALAAAVFADPVVQQAVFDGSGPDRSPRGDWKWLVEVSSKPGVTNPMAITAREALETALGAHFDPEATTVQTATMWLFSSAPEGELVKATVAGLHNPLIQQAVVITRDEWAAGKRWPSLYPTVHGVGTRPVETVPLTALEGDALVKLSKDRLLALSLAEMEAIRGYYWDDATQAHRRSIGLPAEPTDVELEMVAQTWSEHCKHKIFGAHIAYTDAETGESSEIKSLYSTYIKQTTRDHPGPGTHADIFALGVPRQRRGGAV